MNLLSIWIIGAVCWYVGLSFGVRYFVRRWEYSPMPVAIIIVLSAIIWPVSALAVLSYIIIDFKNDWF